MGERPDAERPTHLKRLRTAFRGDDVVAVVMRAVTGVFLVRFAGVALSFGTQLLLANLLGVAEYGVFVYAIVWMNLLVLISRLGVDNTLVRYVSAYRADKDWARLRGLLRRTLQCVVLASVLVVGIGVLVIHALWEHLGESQAATLRIALLLVPIVALAGLRQAALRGLKYVVRAEVPDDVFRPLLFSVALIIAGATGGWSLPAAKAMGLNIVALTAVFVVGTVWLVRAMSRDVPPAEPLYADRDWFGIAVPSLFVSAAFLLLGHADLFMVGALLDSSNAGQYGAALRVSQLAALGTIAANAIAGPLMAEQHASDRPHELRRTVRLCARGAVVCTLPAFLFLTFFGEWVLGFFGPQFAEAYKPLVVLLAGQLLAALGGPVIFLMMMTGHHKVTAYVVCLSALLNIGLNWLLIPRLGITGAALATAISGALASGVMIVYVRWALGVNPTILARGTPAEGSGDR